VLYSRFDTSAVSTLSEWWCRVEWHGAW